MKITPLQKRFLFSQDPRLGKAYSNFEQLIEELGKRDIPQAILSSINQHIDVINSLSGSDNAFRKELRKRQSTILRHVGKELNLVPRHHYRRVWLVIGMTAFGLPLGLVFGAGLDNMALMTIGLPIGMILGIVIGSIIDKKVMQEGKQLDIEIN
ncbi:MAG TPA: hypothetical protein VFF90_08415 [Saprospiraceae bacterium]|nr:hypothetical protein [Saprospiraceae bacterium]